MGGPNYRKQKGDRDFDEKNEGITKISNASHGYHHAKNTETNTLLYNNMLNEHYNITERIKIPYTYGRR